MKESQILPTAISEGEEALPGELPRPAVGAPGSLAAEAPPRPSGWGVGRIAALVVGVLLALASLVLLGAGGTALWANYTQREAGYVTSDVHQFSTSGAALATEETHLGSAGVEWLYSPGLLGNVRIRVTPASSGRPLFVGIGASADVDRYLGGVNHTVISEFFGDKVESVGGGAPASVPGEQRFWVASSTGPGERTVTWDPSAGSWTVVVMNADGRAGIDVGADLGANFPALPWIALAVLVAGALLFAGAALLIVGAIRSSKRTHSSEPKQG